MAYHTPYFVIDENQLTKDFQMLKSSLETSWGNYRIGYSFKTNSLPWLVTFLKAGGVMAEVVSDDEYSLAGALGFSDSEFVYNGPVKKRPSFERVLLAGGILNMDGRRELDWMEELAAALETTPAYLLGLDTPCPPPGFEPLPAMTQVPLIGSIACGTPITAEQNIERYIGVPAAWRADFALTCHGDSMSPTICDGDIVCIRCQPEVEQGEIAAVRIGGEATLKHFHRQGDAVMLLADNAAVCPPMIFTGLQLEELHIEGRAVGFCRGL